MKTFGHFDDEHREYVITDPATPFPWMPVVATSISRMERPYGILAGNPARLPWTAMSAVTV